MVNSAQSAELNVISDRTDFHFTWLFKQFEQKTGIKINSVSVEEGAIAARLAANPGEADLILTTDASVLYLAKDRGWTKPIPPSSVTDDIKTEFIDPDRNYVATSFRGRVIVYNPSTVDVNTLRGYEDLADLRFAGKVCIRPLTHAYNIGLVSQMIVDRGETWTRNWLAGLKHNLAIKPSGNDRNQAKLVASGACDIGVMNTYYYGLMMLSNAERDAASKIRLFFPNQNEKGSYVLTGGAALTKDGKNTNEAVKFIEFLLSETGQNYISGITYQYPVTNIEVPLPLVMYSFGEGQPGIKNGKAKFNFVPLNNIAANRELAVKLVSEVFK